MAGPSLKTLWCHAVGRSDLKPTTKAVAWAIAAHMSPDGIADPSLKRIAEYAGLHRTRLAHHVRLIEQAGLLRVQRSGGVNKSGKGARGGRAKRNIYRACIESPTLERLDAKQSLQRDRLRQETVALGVLNGSAQVGKQSPERSSKGLKGLHEDDVNNGARSRERLKIVKAKDPVNDVEVSDHAP